MAIFRKINRPFVGCIGETPIFAAPKLKHYDKSLSEFYARMVVVAEMPTRFCNRPRTPKRAFSSFLNYYKL